MTITSHTFMWLLLTLKKQKKQKKQKNIMRDVLRLNIATVFGPKIVHLEGDPEGGNPSYTIENGVVEIKDYRLYYMGDNGAVPVQNGTVTPENLRITCSKEGYSISLDQVAEAKVNTAEPNEETIYSLPKFVFKQGPKKVSTLYVKGSSGYTFPRNKVIEITGDFVLSDDNLMRLCIQPEETAKQPERTASWHTVQFDMNNFTQITMYPSKDVSTEIFKRR